MVTDPIADILSELLVSRIADWAPGALAAPGRRATLLYAYPGGDAGPVEAALRVFTGPAEPRRGQRLTVVVLAADPGDLGARLAAGQAGLSAEVSVHLVPGGPDRLPAAAKAAGAAGAPMLAVLDARRGPAPAPAALTAAATGRPAEMLMVLDDRSRTGSDHRQALAQAGFSLVSEVEVFGTSDPGPSLLVFATSSGKRLEAFKDGIWVVGATIGVRYRAPDGATGPVEVTPSPDPEPLARRLLQRLTEVGRCSVSELREFTVSRTAYRSRDANQAIGDLLAAGLVVRDPATGRLGGDVSVELAPTSAP
ncbi:hypothetical protein ACI2K4_10205 [Micromonospora sp. NPDC050397]|uniref:hypothetical protein n=1 Tax=Micromonospora sp. NPDC050397 TaxID=3364279 RepID=UPI0038516333